MIVRGYSLISGICLCAAYVGVWRAYPSQTLPFARLAEAPVVATCLVQETRYENQNGEIVFKTSHQPPLCDIPSAARRVSITYPFENGQANSGSCILWRLI